jgi:hypothetical protein
VHYELVTRGSVITARGPAGEPCIAATYRHQLGDYLRPAAARAAGGRPSLVIWHFQLPAA